MLDVTGSAALGRHSASRPAPSQVREAFAHHAAADRAADPMRLRVLVVEDDAGDHAVIDRALRRMPRYEPLITLAGGLATGRLALDAQDFDIALIDHTLHDGTGTALITELGGRLAPFPCILLSSLMTCEVERDALRIGAAACLSKDDIRPRILETAMHQALRAHGLETAVQALAVGGREMPAAPVAATCQTMLEEMITSAEAIERELASKPQLAASYWGAAKMRCLATTLTELVRIPARGGAGTTAAAGVVDLQAVVIEASGRWRQDGCGRSAVALHLADRPVYVSGSAGALTSMLDALLIGLAQMAPVRRITEIAVTETSPCARVVIGCEPGTGHRPTAPVAAEPTGAKTAHVSDLARLMVAQIGGTLSSFADDESSATRLVLSLPLVPRPAFAA